MLEGQGENPKVEAYALEDQVRDERAVVVADGFDVSVGFGVGDAAAAGDDGGDGAVCPTSSVEGFPGLSFDAVCAQSNCVAAQSQFDAIFLRKWKVEEDRL